MVSRLVYVPTDRLSEHSLRAYAAEADALHDAGVSSAFVLVESNDAAHVAHHAALLEDLRARLSVPLIHFDLARQAAFMQILFLGAGIEATTAAWLRNVLLTSRLSYGAGPNKAALLASFLGAESLHRRDSDTVPQVLDGVPLHPSHLEVAVIGRRIGEARRMAGHASGPNPTLPVLAVGTDYLGAPALDRHAFARLSVELLSRHEALDHPDATDPEIAARIHRKYVHRDQSPYIGDRVEIDEQGRTEMGAFAIAELFRLVPEMPLTDTLGTDYFVKNLAYRLGLPVVWHSRRVVHDHAVARDPSDAVLRFVHYAMRDANLKVLRRLWRVMNRHLDEALEPGTAGDLGRFDVEGYAECAERAVRETRQDDLVAVLRDLQVLHRDAAEAAETRGEDGTAFRTVCALLTRQAPFRVTAVQDGFRDFARLIRMWPRLIASAVDASPARRAELTRILEQ